MGVAAAVLAAGAGTRFDSEGPKLLAPFRGRPLVRWAVDAAVDAGFDEVLVVVGAVDVASVLPDGVSVIANDRWEEGQATSLAAAVAAAGERDHDVLVIALGDQPMVAPEAWRAVAAASSPIAIATYDGRRGHPVRLHRSVWSQLPSSGDVGARVLMAERPELVTEVACFGDPADIDTLEDLERWS